MISSRYIFVLATFGASVALSFHLHATEIIPNSMSDSDLYPAPNATGSLTNPSWHAAFLKATSLVSQMTLSEKSNLTSGIMDRCAGNLGSVPRLSVPGFCLQDGPAGLRGVRGGSQFPAGLTVAATWDKDLIYRRARAMGEEWRDQGVHIALAPVAGGPLGRSPRDGRNWEGWFTDPYGSGVASYLSVKGIQGAGVRATLKHFISYEQETFRNGFNTTESYSVFPANTQAPISSNIDDKTMHEVYLWSFAEAVRAGASNVMCSLNAVNNTYACHNAYVLNHLLKGELNFQGSIMSDWTAQYSAIQPAFAGLDISMPGLGLPFPDWGGNFWTNIADFISNGSIPEWRFNDMVIRTLTSYFWLGQDADPLPLVVYNQNTGLFDAPNVYRDVRKNSTKDLIRDIAAQGITLLKNSGSLPLHKPARIAVIGTDAGDGERDPSLCSPLGDNCPLGTNNGTLTLAGGSGWANSPYIVTPLDALKLRAIADDSEIGWILSDQDYTVISQLASPASVTLVFVSAYAREGEDRANLTLQHDGDALITAAASLSNNVVVVMHIPGVVNVEKWADNENVTAIVAAWLPGQESGNALVDALYGDVNPSGKLPFTWGKSEGDYPPNGIVDDPVLNPQSNFSEGVFVDYRWFDSRNIAPRYEFGFGLSYTTFEYSNLTYVPTSEPDNTSIMATAEPFDGQDESNSLYDIVATFTATVTNTGNVTGSDVAQLYISIPEEREPPRVLRGFDKVKDLHPGDQGTATFGVRRKDLSVWSVERQTWSLPNGTFTVFVGTSSRNLPLATTLSIVETSL